MSFLFLISTSIIITINESLMFYMLRIYVRVVLVYASYLLCLILSSYWVVNVSVGGIEYTTV